MYNHSYRLRDCPWRESSGHCAERVKMWWHQFPTCLPLTPISHQGLGALSAVCGPTQWQRAEAQTPSALCSPVSSSAPFVPRKLTLVGLPYDFHLGSATGKCQQEVGKQEGSGLEHGLPRPSPCQAYVSSGCSSTAIHMS